MTQWINNALVSDEMGAEFVAHQLLCRKLMPEWSLTCAIPWTMMLQVASSGVLSTFSMPFEAEQTYTDSFSLLMLAKWSTDVLTVSLSVTVNTDSGTVEPLPAIVQVILDNGTLNTEHVTVAGSVTLTTSSTGSTNTSGASESGKREREWEREGKKMGKCQERSRNGDSNKENKEGRDRRDITIVTEKYL